MANTAISRGTTVVSTAAQIGVWASTASAIDGTPPTAGTTYATLTQAANTGNTNATASITIGGYTFGLATTTNLVVDTNTANLTMAIRHYESSTTYVGGVEVQLQTSAGATIGTSVAVTKTGAAAIYNAHPTTVPTAQNLVDGLRCAVAVTHNNSSRAATFYLDEVDITVTYNYSVSGTVAATLGKASAAFAGTSTPKPAVSTLQDDFATKDTTAWLWGADASETLGQLQLSPLANGFVLSVGRYDLTGSAMVCQLVQATNNSGDASTYIGLARDGYNLAQQGFAYYITGGQMYFVEWNPGLPGSATVMGPITMPATPVWLRLRESGGTVYWDTSVDGIGWTNRASITPTTPITSLYYWWQATNSSGGTPGVALVDNVNPTIPGTPPYRHLYADDADTVHASMATATEVGGLPLSYQETVAAGQLIVSGGKLTLSAASAAAGYLCFDAGRDVTHMRARICFYGAGKTTTGSVFCLAITNKLLTSTAMLNDADFKAGVHYIVGPTAWSLQYYDGATGSATTVANGALTTLAQDGTGYEIGVWRNGNTVTVLAPDGYHTATHANFGGWSSRFGWFEPFYPNTTDSIPGAYEIEAGIGAVAGSVRETLTKIAAALAGSQGTGATSGTITVAARKLAATLSGAMQPTGSAAVTTRKVTASFGGAHTQTGTAATVLRKTTASLAGYMRPSGTIAAAQPKTSANLSGSQTQSGAAAAALGKAAASFAGVMQPKGAITATLRAASASLSGSHTQSGTVSAALQKASASLSGPMSSSGTVSAAVNKATAALAGAQIISGTSVVAIKKLSATWLGYMRPSGVISAGLAKATAVLSGSQTQSGTVVAATAKVAASLAGVEQPRGTISVTAQKATAVLSGSQIQTSTLAGALQKAAASLAATMQPKGVIAATLRKTATALVGAQTQSGVTAATLAKATASLTAVMQPKGAIAATAKKPTAALSGSHNRSGELASTLRKATTALVGSQRQTGTAAATLVKLQTTVNGYMRPTGAVTVTVTKPTYASSGAHTQTGAISFAAVKRLQASIAGVEQPRGTITSGIKKLSASASGGLVGVASITAAIRKAAAALSGGFYQAVTGSITASAKAPAATASGLQLYRAIVAAELRRVAASTQGDQAQRGAITATAEAVTATLSGFIPAEGGIAADLSALSFAGVANYIEHYVYGVFAAALTGPQAQGSGYYQPNTPGDRIVTIPADDRTIVVSVDDRTITVGGDNRQV